MNSYWLKVSLAVVIVVNIALAVSLFYYHKKGVSPFDNSQLPSFVTKLESKARDYTDKASTKAAEELNKFKAEVTDLRAKVDKELSDLRKEIKSRK